MVLDGYMDFLRAKAYVQAQASSEAPTEQTDKKDEFEDSEVDILAREIDHT
jgi:hypothetical protein